MDTAHIYIYGDIGCWQSKDASDWGEVTLTEVRNQYEAQKDAETITLHIHSPGGYVTEGFAIHDYLRSLGKPITTIIEGMCYSIATVIALAGDTRSMTSNSEFMIHNPWGGAMGESSEIQKYADELRKEENRIAEFYAAKTKITSDQALELMKAETFMTPEKALENGFITQIATVMKAVALYKPKNKKMSKKTLTKEEASGLLDGFLEKMKNILKPSSKINNKIVQDANGQEIDFTELEDDDTPSVGDKATIDGKTAEGEVLMPNGETYVFVSGELTEIKEVDNDDDSDNEVEALNEEVVNLKKELKAEKKVVKNLMKENEQMKNLLNDAKKDIKSIKKSIGSNFSHDAGGKKDKKKNKNEGKFSFKK